MTTKVIVKCPAENVHSIVVKGMFPTLEGGYQDTQEINPGEEKELWCHSSRALVIDEGAVFVKPEAPKDDGLVHAEDGSIVRDSNGDPVQSGGGVGTGD